jgi:hypothetical protein
VRRHLDAEGSIVSGSLRHPARSNTFVRRTGAVAVALVCVAASCGGSSSDSENDTTDAPSIAPPTSVPTSAPDSESTSTTDEAAQELSSLPLPGFEFDVDSEVDVAQDLRGLTRAGDLLFAFTPPHSMLRIDPVKQQVDSLVLGIGPSVGGAPSWVVDGDRMWVIGGAFRDELIEIDTSSMTEIRRIKLDDDHSVAAASTTEVWLMTAHAVQRLDAASGTLDPPITLEVDPGDVAVAPDGTVWVTLPLASQVARIDPRSGEVDTFDVAPGPSWLVVDTQSVWVSHPPVASISRLDQVTGETIALIDLDLSGGTVASVQTGALQTTEDGVWATISFPGSRFRNGHVLLDSTNAVVAARSAQFDSNTWEAVDGGIWIHRLPRGSILRASIEGLNNAPPTDEGELLPTDSTVAPPTTEPPPLSSDELALEAALNQILDASVQAADLGIEAQASARNDLIALAAAQADLSLQPSSVTIHGDAGTTVFDVTITGNTVILPGVQLEWKRTDDAVWHVTPESFCRVTDGVGIAGCTP